MKKRHRKTLLALNNSLTAVRDDISQLKGASLPAQEDEILASIMDVERLLEQGAEDINDIEDVVEGSVAILTDYYTLLKRFSARHNDRAGTLTNDLLDILI